MLLRSLRSVFVAFLIGFSTFSSLVYAQSYQTQFGEVKFDRAKGPATFHGGVEVDGASGHLSVNIPLGPGIGARGLKFQPTLQGQWAPQTEVYPMYIGQTRYGIPSEATDPTAWVELPRAVASGGFSLTPGFFQLTFDEEPSDSFFENFLPTKIPGRRLTNFQGPEGWGASVSMETPLVGEVPSQTEAKALATTFGFTDAGWTIGRMVDQVCSPSTEQFIRRGPGGELILGLEHPTLAKRQFAVPIIGTAIHPGASTPDTYFWFPSRFLVIRGDLAYEFEWRSNRYSAIEKTWFFQNTGDTLDGQSLAAWTGHRFLRHAAFALKSVRNRFGDVIEITATDTGDWTAAWKTSAGSTGASIKWEAGILSYQGDGDQPSYSLVGIASNEPTRADAEGSAIGPVSIKRPYDGFKSRKITSLTNQVSGEVIQFGFGSTSLMKDALGNPCEIIDTLNQVIFPGRVVTVSWADQTEFYRNMPNELGMVSDHYLACGASKTNGYNWLPVYRWGVDRITEYDNVSGGVVGPTSLPINRITTHSRKVPQPTRKFSPMWSSTAFYDLISHPDGRSTLTRYMEPLEDIGGVGSPVEKRMQTLAYLKHQPVEIRHYASNVDATQDIVVQNPTPGQTYLAPLSSSVAYKVEVYDRWDLRGPTNPDGQFDLSAVPFATRIRTWDKLENVQETKEFTNWDRDNRGWQSVHSVRENVATAPLLSVDMLSRAQNLVDVATLSLSPSLGTYRVETRNFDANVAQWIFSRPSFEQVVAQKDAAVAAASGQTFPFNLPASSKIYDSTHPELNRLSSVQVGSVTTQFQYSGNAGMSGNQLNSATLSGPFLLNNQVGATYGYDSKYGFLNKIQPNLMTWDLKQASDSLGRAISQSEANGILTTYRWDGAGRLVAIQPPGTEKGTVITPDPDNRGYTVDHGWQTTQYRYNGFGELVLERRLNGGNWSHRVFGYDAGGRKVAETVWLDGMGDETEWKAPNLVQAAQVLTYYQPGRYVSVCAMYDQITGACIKSTKEWVPADIRYQGAGGLHIGSSFTYDEYGRPTGSMDPNGQQNVISYGVRKKTVTQGFGTTEAVSTSYENDVDGRLWKVTDANSRVTQYLYDPAGRIKSVTQWAGPGTTGAAQVRSWKYNDEGWLTELVQPESGKTVYSDFTVLGKPTVTTYFGDGTKPSFSVTTTPDTLGRTTKLVASDGSVDQSIGYDESGHGYGLNKMTSATANESGVTRSLTYSGLNGRLSSLSRTVDGLPAFNISLAWNDDGTLSSRTYPDGKVQNLLYDSYKGLPNGTLFPGGSVTTLAYDSVHWGLSAITYPGSTTTFMSYDNDQNRLKYMGHYLGSSPKREWNYRFDGAGRLATDGEDQYGYDALGRLTSVLARDVNPTTRSFIGSSAALAQNLDYDAFGNRVSLSTLAVNNWAWGTAPPATLSTTSVSGRPDLRSYAMNATEISAMAATNHLPGTIGGVLTGASYDGFGNLTGMFRNTVAGTSQLTMTYDALGRVHSLSGAAQGVTEIYAYDDEGLRISTEFWKDGFLQNKVYAIYNEARQLISEYELVSE